MAICPRLFRRNNQLVLMTNLEISLYDTRTMSLAQSTQKPLVVQVPSPTKSDDELMAVKLPEDSVTVSQIIEELRSVVCVHLPIHSVTMMNLNSCNFQSFQSGTPVSNIDPALIDSSSRTMVEPLGAASSSETNDKPPIEATETTSVSVSLVAMIQLTL